MLDIHKGKLVINKLQFVVDKNLNKEKFLYSPLSKLIFNKFESANWISYSIQPQYIMGKTFGLTFTFKDSIFQTLALSYSEMKEIPYDKENEEKRKAVHDAWLQELFGEPHEYGPFWTKYKFTWGSISSSLDPRAGQSIIYFAFETD
ncbi:hypothetical protein QUF49_19700 [Fictibacillus sp. b24]|uniref:hypothetical protein n=1 Tax=unclassified Fictibacillus TaxID=2644029 RepID=UPI0025A01380|nr:hypothetical protein [Fictibacillus sp. b24]MDM5318226.1 hypothetical protein [Fictibacillus sp. b24]